MNNKLKILTLFFVIIFLYSCQTAQEALQGKKRSEQGDEFLVQKKNPLTLPPDFEKLPIPGQDEESLYSISIYLTSPPYVFKLSNSCT